MKLAQAVIDLQGQAVDQGLPFANSLSTPEAGFGNFLSGILGAIMLIAVLLTLLYLVWGAISWISSGGDKAKTEKARDQMTQAVIGLIVLAATLVIMMLVQSFLGVSILRFGSGGGGSVAGGGIGAGSGSGSGGGGGSSGGGSTTGCNGTAIGAVVSDGGSGGYCSGGGAAQVQCRVADSHLPYAHFDPCSCLSGSQISGYDFDSC